MKRHAAFAAAALLAATALAGCSSEQVAECSSNLVTTPLPDWASTGFTPGTAVPHVVGADGLIIAVPFTQPLMATGTGADPQNKVLLVAKTIPTGSAPMMIDAQLNGNGDVVHLIRKDGPGPGTLDLPLPGCWRVTMHWADQVDSVDLDYVANPTAMPSDLP